MGGSISLARTTLPSDTFHRDVVLEPQRRQQRKKWMNAATLHIPGVKRLCAELAGAIRAGFAAGEASKRRVSLLWEHSSTGRQLTAKGYRNYGLVHGKHDATEQFKVTGVLPGDATLWQYCSVLPHLADVLMFVTAHAPGRHIAFVHILNQSSSQAQFSWHVDNNPRDTGYGDIELSYVFCLTEGQSSMQIAGYEVFQYGGAGQGAVFNAAFWHASVHAEPGTVKVAVFLNCK